MGKLNFARGGTTRGVSSIRGKTRGGSSGRGSLTSKGILATRGGGASPISTLAVRGSDSPPVRNTAAARGNLTNRGKGKDPLQRTKDDNVEKNVSKKSEKKIYKVSLTNAVVKKLIAAKSKGVHMKINVSDKMEIDTGEGEKIQLSLSSPKKVEMIFIRNGDMIEPAGNVIGCADNTSVIGCADNTSKSHAAVKRDLVAKKLRESYEKETKGKRKVQVLGLDKLPSEQEMRTKPKRQKNNVGPSIKVQSPPTTFPQAPSNKVSSQLSSTARGGKPIRRKARGGRTKTTVSIEATEIDDAETTIPARGVNISRGGKPTGNGKSTRSRGAKTVVSDTPKVSALTTQSTRGKRGRPAGVTNRTTRGAKTYTTRTSTAAFKTSSTIKNDSEQQSSEGTTSSSSKKEKEKRKGKTNRQSESSSEWKPGQTITILAEFKQARKICEDMENDIQEVIESLSTYESFYNICIKSVIKGSFTHDCLRDIEKHFGDGSPANKLIQKYLQLEKDINIIHDELWRAANEGPIYED